MNMTGWLSARLTVQLLCRLDALQFLALEHVTLQVIKGLKWRTFEYQYVQLSSHSDL